MIVLYILQDILQDLSLQVDKRLLFQSHSRWQSCYVSLITKVDIYFALESLEQAMAEVPVQAIITFSFLLTLSYSKAMTYKLHVSCPLQVNRLMRAGGYFFIKYFYEKFVNCLNIQYVHGACPNDRQPMMISSEVCLSSLDNYSPHTVEGKLNQECLHTLMHNAHR